jgi:peptide/nickel transport system ATP-binding protein
LSAVPIADTNVKKRKIVLQGEIPSQSNPPKGCPFSTRCPYVMRGLCDTTAPPQREFGHRHVIACHLAPDELLAMEPVITIEPGAALPPPPPMAAGAGAAARNDAL